MPAYWWQCTSCSSIATFAEMTVSTGLPSFLWDELRPSNWDQGLLRRHCSRCSTPTMQVAHHFPREKRETVTVNHIVGLVPSDKGYMPMMWEGAFLSDPESPLFDFKYVIERQNWGLNKPAVFSREDLRHLFDLYCNRISRKRPL
jgi:hypothetical protein